MKTIISADKSRTPIMVDDDVFVWAKRFPWKVTFRRTIDIRWDTRCNNKRVVVRLSRVIMGCPPDKYVDHKDHDPLNNQRYNLRITTLSGNNRNTSSRRGSSSKYLGVSWEKCSSRWKAQIHHEKDINLGRFINEDDAARAYNQAALKYHGEYANLNLV